MISHYDKAHIGDILAGEGDWFSARLLRLCMNADSRNLELLRIVFPDAVNAFEKYKTGPTPKTYWLTLAITDVELASAMDCPLHDLEDGDYIGGIRDYGEVVKLEKLEELKPETLEEP